MLALLIAALLQAAPESAPAPKTVEVPAAVPSLRDNGLPKDDYSLVAWCHGAVAGQLELDPIVKADMEKIEGKAKVAARAASDAEMEKERRVYLKDYEHALAAAEAANPRYIHETGVRAEERGYGLWTPTRNKAPIWRMLDWGMWDPNDVGCGDAAKRLQEKSSLFGEALKGADEPDKPVEAPVARAEKPSEVMADLNSGKSEHKDDAITAEAKAPLPEAAGAPSLLAAPPAAEPPAAEAPATEAAAQPAPAPVKTTARKTTKGRTPAKVKPVETAAAPTETPATAAPTAEASEAARSADQPAAATAPATRKVAARKTAPKKLSMDSSAEDIRDAIARGKAELAAEPAAAPAPATDQPPALRGPQ